MQTSAVGKTALEDLPLIRRGKVRDVYDMGDALLIVACAEGCEFHSAMLGTEWTSWTERWKHR